MDIKNNLNKVEYYFRRYGFLEVSKKIFKRVFHIKENRKSNQEQYKIWMEKNNLKEQDVENQKANKFEYSPKISIVVPMYNTNEIFFKELVESLENQTYSNWELCLADGSETQNESLKQYYENNEKIKYKFLNENKGISENTNAAIDIATGEYIGFLDHDDLLSKDALYEVVKIINENSDNEFIYSDEDKIDQTGERFEPYFKPDYSPETLECNNYITHFVVVKKELIENVGKFNSEFNGAQDFDFVLRATYSAKNVAHISKILYHWRVHRDSTANVADAKPYAYEAGIKATEAHIKRTGRKGTAENGQDVPGIYKIKYEIQGNPKVSILIPNKDNVNLLKNCIDSILKLTTYKNYEIVVIENNSEKKETLEYYNEISKNEKIRIINSGIKEFNYSRIINFCVKNVTGEFVLQLNNDTKVLTPDWLELMIGYAQNKEIGAVGARLYYEDKTIQHAGIIVGLSGIAGNMLVNLPYGKHAYFGREAATRNVAAVTGACLLCRRELYEEVGFMDEEKFKVAFNDVDFCLKLLEKGYRNIYNPYVELIHYESKSRGYEYTKEQEERFNKEAENFKSKWKKYIDYDPYYNINFTRDTCNYDIKID
ncbi:MAG: glycosyltransferase family 2 protein [Clostridia bacterium]|nr:glycosyltransferase family 2 protein [Clostridia bacterium]